ncbi:c2H2-type domain-containing protein [Nephila pilipes]|uniref:C2H2-type domain-containing protein n=1 Tax=Nephila pilipes TaxID=299642 RepID=A0A8X6JFT6_NEPPI|nr:c2H2-type domain-containing protein [Nephila pilipes]
MDNFQTFSERHLHRKETFFSSLINVPINDDGYAHCKNVWETFNLKTLGEYHDLYVTSDVILLADFFQNFLQLVLNSYKLDPSHCYTALGLAWQTCLHMSRVKLELFTDMDMHLFIERGIRSGISMIAHIFNSANYKYLDSYDEVKPSKYIPYLHANNLNGLARPQFLPTHGLSGLKSLLILWKFRMNLT